MAAVVQRSYRVNELTPDPAVVFDRKIGEQYLRYAHMLAARGHFVAVLAPVLAPEAVRARPAEVSFDVEQLPEPAVLEHALHLAQRGLEAPVVADGERDLALGAHGNRPLAFGARQAERLLDEHVLAGLGRRRDLLRMRRVRRGEHHRIDRTLFQEFVIVGDEADAVCAAEVGCLLRRARGAGRETDGVALALDGRDEVLAPGAEPDDCRLDHRLRLYNDSALQRRVSSSAQVETTLSSSSRLPRTL